MRIHERMCQLLSYCPSAPNPPLSTLFCKAGLDYTNHFCPSLPDRLCLQGVLKGDQKAGEGRIRLHSVSYSWECHPSNAASPLQLLFLPVTELNLLAVFPTSALLCLPKRTQLSCLAPSPQRSGSQVHEHLPPNLQTPTPAGHRSEFHYTDHLPLLQALNCNHSNSFPLFLQIYSASCFLHVLHP